MYISCINMICMNMRITLQPKLFHNNKTHTID